MTVDQFPDWEETEVHAYRQSFLRAFGDKGADFVIIDSRRNIWLMQAIKWAVEKELLYYDEEESNRRSDEQYTAMAFRPTVQGALNFSGGTNPEKGAPHYDIKGEVGERVILRRPLRFMTAEMHDKDAYRLILEAGALLDIVEVSKRYDHDLHDKRMSVRVTGTPFIVTLLSKDLEGIDPATYDLPL
jgi:hypothetical protein